MIIKDFVAPKASIYVLKSERDNLHGEVVSENQLGQQIGNAMSCNVLERILAWRPGPPQIWARFHDYAVHV